MSTNDDTIFINQKYTLRLDTGKPLSGATCKIAYRKPDGTTGTWDATGAGTELNHEVTSAENDTAGTWYFHSYVQFSGETTYTPGERVSLRVLRLYED